MKKQLLLTGILLCLWLGCFLQAHSQTGSQPPKQHLLSGKITDRANGLPVPGALVTVPGEERYALADESGEYSLSLPEGTRTLLVTYLGYEPLKTDVRMDGDTRRDFEISGEGLLLDEFEMVHTGYEELPRERATGSFVTLDRELVGRRVSTNLLERLEDVTPGLVFNRAGTPNDPISIRGRNTIYANTRPLVIVDNFPYDGPLEAINPNDVESVTVLRDAAAASIWGARAGNGVIVVTTRQGSAGPPRLSFNANVNAVEPPDLFYRPQLAASDFIDVERMLFDRGFYGGSEASFNRPPLSPAVETLIAARDGRIGPEEAESRLAEFAGRDIRRDLGEHYYRPTVNQQYSLGLSGGTDRHRYAVSAGVDRNATAITGNGNSRITFSANNNWKSANGRLEAGAGIYYSRQDTRQTTELPPEYYPFDRLADGAGNPLPITQKYSVRYLQSEDAGRLGDWTYTPLDEIGRQSNSSVGDDVRLNLSTGYQLLPGLRAEVKYQYWQHNRHMENYRDPSLFYVRDLVNQFTQTNPDGSLYRAVPEGGILDREQSRSHSHSFRGQLAYSREFGDGHELSAIAGYEVKDLQAETGATRYYGYDRTLSLSQPVDAVTRFRRYHSGALAAVFDGAAHSGTVERFLSQYANAGYAYRKKYLLSASARRDASNLFGVETNMRAVPLWSAGLGWVISGEDFYPSGKISHLKLRASYGYNGNVDRSLSALTAATYFTVGSWSIAAGELGGQITNPPNPRLGWERIGITNLGLDLESENGRIAATVEVYQKRGRDLIGDSPMVPSTGVSRFRGNFANTMSRGMDIDVRSDNLTGEFGWRTNFLVSGIREKVTDYFYRGTVLNYLEGTTEPLEGRPLFGLYSLPWGGLDPDTGAPRGMLDGEPSTDHAAIFAALTPETLTYHGPARPTGFGAVRNTFRYRNFTLSVNTTYRLGHYYRRESVRYATILQGRGAHPDYTRRWRQPGDEQTTQVPSMPASVNIQRDNLYNYSDLTVESANHIRLQDARLGYNLPERKAFRGGEVYVYANNLGILWKATDEPLDPDFRLNRPLRSVAVGLRLDF